MKMKAILTLLILLNLVSLNAFSQDIPYRTLEGHSDPVLSLVFSPDGRTLASGSSDSTIRLWDAKTGELLRTLAGHSRSVFSVAFSPNGQTLASGSYQTIRLWDLSSVVPTTGEPEVEPVDAVNPSDLAATPVDPESVQNLTNHPGPKEPIRFRVSLKNEGTVESIATTLHLYVPVTSKTDATTGYTFAPDFTNAPLKKTVSIDPLPANSSEIEEFLTFTAPEKAGTYHYKVCVDSDSGKVGTTDFIFKLTLG